MNFRSASVDDLPALAALAAPLQARPERHIAYLGTDRVGIEAELAETSWATVSVVATGSGDRGRETIDGWLIGDVDEEMGRVWWFGPFVRRVDDWQPLATELLAQARRQLPPGVDEEELAVDARFDGFEPWAVESGFVADCGSWVLTLDGALDEPDAACDLRSMTDDQHDAVASLHDELFPGTHTAGRQLVEQQDERHPRLVARVGGGVTGYIAVERQPDGSGYIDFLGVSPSARRSGVGGALVRAGVAALRAIGAESVHLTVREGSAGARELYASLGFTEERLIRPFRRGFGLE